MVLLRRFLRSLLAMTITIKYSLWFHGLFSFILQNRFGCFENRLGQKAKIFGSLAKRLGSEPKVFGW